MILYFCTPCSTPVATVVGHNKTFYGVLFSFPPTSVLRLHWMTWQREQKSNPFREGFYFHTCDFNFFLIDVVNIYQINSITDNSLLKFFISWLFKITYSSSGCVILFCVGFSRTYYLLYNSSIITILYMNINRYLHTTFLYYWQLYNLWWIIYNPFIK